MKKLIIPSLFLLLTACAATPTVETGPPLTGASGALLTVRGMSCPLCSNNIDGRLKKVEGVRDVTIDLETGQVTVRFTETSRPTRRTLASAVKEAGFTLGKLERIE